MSAPHSSAGWGSSQQYDLSIGRIPFRFHTSDEKLHAAAVARYSGFAGKELEPNDVHVSESASSDDTTAEFLYKFEGARLQAAPGRTNFAGVRNEYAFDTLLRILLSWKLLRHDGFLLHAATIVRNGRAYIFMGKSGAGKSTIASLAPKGSVLTDEISLLRREKGEWRAYGTPFWGEFRAKGANADVPVAGIFRLVQSRKNDVTPLRGVQFLRSVLPNVLFFSADVEENGRLLEILGRAVTEIPGHTLAFRKDRTFWEVLPA